jgi:hypothetical protein
MARSGSAAGGLALTLAALLLALAPRRATALPGPADTAFYLSGSASEGVAAFDVTGAAPSFVADHLGIASGALALASGTYLSVAGASAPAALPAGGSVAFSASAWVKCAAPSTYAAVLEWGAAGDAGSLASPQAAALTVGGTALNAGVMTTLAGDGFKASNTLNGRWLDGPGSAASFNFPMGVAVIPSSSTIVVADGSNHRIRLVTYPEGSVSTLAGHCTSVDVYGYCQGGSADGTGEGASFNGPHAVAVIPTGESIVVADSNNCRIRILTPSGVTSTLAGGVCGFADGVGTSAMLSAFQGIAVVPSSSFVVVPDGGNCRIRIVTLSGAVSTLAGGTCGFADGEGSNAMFNWLNGAAVMPTSETIVIADLLNYRIRLVTPLGLVSTLAGNSGSGFVDGTGTAATFFYPWSVAAFPSGAVAVSDFSSIRLVQPSGAVSTLAGGPGFQGGLQNTAFADGVGTNALFSSAGVAVVPSSGAIVTADYMNYRIRVVTQMPFALPACDSTWHHTALVYSPAALPRTLSAFLDGELVFTSAASVTLPARSASTLRIGWSGELSSGSNAGSLFAGSLSNLRFYNRTLSADEVLLLSKPPLPTFANAVMSPLLPSPTVTSFTWWCIPGFAGPTVTLARDAADGTWASSDGAVNCTACPASTYSFGGGFCSPCVAGTVIVSPSAGCRPLATLMPGPADTAFFISGMQTEGVASFAPLAGSSTPGGASFVADHLGVPSGALALANGTRLTATGASVPAALPAGGSVNFSTSAWVHCKATGSYAAVLEWGSASETVFNSDLPSSFSATPSAIALLVSGQVPTASSSPMVIRAGLGVVTTTLGGGNQYSSPAGVAILPSSGSVVVSENGGNSIRIVTPAGIVTTLAGNFGACAGAGGTAFAADGVGTSAFFCGLRAVAVIPTSEVIVVADSLNNRIRLVTTQAPAGTVTTLAGGGSSSGVQTGFRDAPGVTALFNALDGLALLPSGIAMPGGGTAAWPVTGVIVVADASNHRIRLVTYPAGAVTTLAGSGSTGLLDGTGTNALFNGPAEIAPLPSGAAIAVADALNRRIRLVTYPGGVVTTLAGSGSSSYVDGAGDFAGFGSTTGLAVLLGSSATNGAIAVVDALYNAIRLVSYPDGFVTTLAGYSPPAFMNLLADGTGYAQFNTPQKVVVNPFSGALIVSDSGNGAIRIVSLPPVLPACDGTWHHTALTYAPAALPFALSGYLDGALVFASAATVTLPARSASTLHIGWSGDLTSNAGSLFAGALSNLRIYSRALSPSEVTALSELSLSAPVPSASSSVTATASASSSPTITQSASSSASLSALPTSSSTATHLQSLSLLASSSSTPAPQTRVLAGAVQLAGSALNISLSSVGALTSALFAALQMAVPASASAGVEVDVTRVSDAATGTVLYGVAGAAAGGTIGTSVGGARRQRRLLGSSSAWAVSFVALVPISLSQAAVAGAVFTTLTPGSAESYSFVASLLRLLAASSDASLQSVNGATVQAAASPAASSTPSAVSADSAGGTGGNFGISNAIAGATAGVAVLLLVGLLVRRHLLRKAALVNYEAAHPHLSLPAPDPESSGAVESPLVIKVPMAEPAPDSVSTEGGTTPAEALEPSPRHFSPRAGPPSLQVGLARAHPGSSGATERAEDVVEIISAQNGGAGEDGAASIAGSAANALRNDAGGPASLLPGQIDEGLLGSVAAGVASALDAVAPTMPALGIALTLVAGLLRQLTAMDDAGREHGVLRRRLERLRSLVERAGQDEAFVASHASIFEGLVDTLRVASRALAKMSSRGRLGRFVSARGDLERLSAIDTALSLHVNELAAAMQVETLHAVRSLHELGLGSPGSPGGPRSPLSPDDIQAVSMAAATAALAGLPPRERKAPPPLPPFSMQFKLDDLLFIPPLEEQLPTAPRGSFGVVCFATWRAHKLPVAVKLIAARTPMGAAAVSMMTWLAEAELMRRLREHRSPASGLPPQHVVTLFGIGAVEDPRSGETDKYLVVMERLEGSLRDVLDGYLARARQPPLEHALRWLLETAQGLAECHEANVVHSDVKAANTLIDAARHAKIGDLGAGRVTRGLSATASLAGSTAGGNARGSVLWLASELVDDPSNLPSKASDVYAWACMAFEILSCRLPYHDDKGVLVTDINTLKNMFAIVSGKLRPDLAAVRADAPPAVVELVRRSWAPDPRERPPIAEVALTLEAIVEVLRSSRQGTSESAAAADAADAQSAAVKRAAAEAEADDARNAAAELAALTQQLKASRAERIEGIRKRRAEAEANMRTELEAAVTALEAESAKELAEETRRAEAALEARRVALMDAATRATLAGLDDTECERLVRAFKEERAAVEAKVEAARREKAARLEAQLAARRDAKVRAALAAAEAESAAERVAELARVEAALSVRAAELLAPAEAARASALARALPSDAEVVARVRAEFEAEREAVEAQVKEARRAQRAKLEASLATRAAAKAQVARLRAEAEAESEEAAETRQAEAAAAVQRAELLAVAREAHVQRVRASGARALGDADATRLVAEFDIERMRVEARVDEERERAQRALESRLAARREAKQKEAEAASLARRRALDEQAVREEAAEARKSVRELLREQIKDEDEDEED